MRLLKLPSLEFEEFHDSPPPYAILSHTWEKEEVTYQEMTVRSRRTKAKSGFAKIARFADVAALSSTSSLWFGWVDTCCIDKSSSQELSYSINSMYQWYQRASRCCVYLADVSSVDGFASSRWFTRGWTLQELIAPRKVEFYDKNWNYLGDKRTLEKRISAVTGIPRIVLRRCDPSLVSVARRMSWASMRTTTRVEDIAYSLMGIFDVNMPLLYGEGRKAFIRLQEEIMKASDDHSLFAWKARSDSSTTYRGLLAESPEEFQDAAQLDLRRADEGLALPYSMTNLGINLTLPLVPWPEARLEWGLPSTSTFEDENFFLGVLNLCHIATKLAIGIRLVRLSGGNQYARIDAHCLDFTRASAPAHEIFVRQIPKVPKDHQTSRIHALLFPSWLAPRYSRVRIWDQAGLLKSFQDSRDGGDDVLVKMDSVQLEEGATHKKFTFCLQIDAGVRNRQPAFDVHLVWNPVTGDNTFQISERIPVPWRYDIISISNSESESVRRGLHIKGSGESNSDFDVFITLETKLVSGKPVLAFHASRVDSAEDLIEHESRVM